MAKEDINCTFPIEWLRELEDFIRSSLVMFFTSFFQGKFTIEVSLLPAGRSGGDHPIGIWPRPGTNYHC